MGTSLRRTKSTKSDTNNKLKNQLNNYNTRLSALGKTNVTDTRNWFEKLTNLDEGQNVLFDIFELLDRPRNALFTGIDEAAQGGSFFEGLKEGFTGETDTTGKDLLMNYTGLEDEEGKLNLVDALGFGLDVVGDPTNWVTFGGKSAMDIGTDLLGKGVKTLGKGADNVITKGLTALDNMQLNKLKKAAGNLSVDDYLKTIGKTADDFLGRADTYAGFKRGITDTFNQAKTTLGKLKTSKRNAKGLNELLDRSMKNYSDDLGETAYKYVLNNLDEADELLKYTDDIEALNKFLKEGQSEGKRIIDFINENDSEFSKLLKQRQNTVAGDILDVIESNRSTKINNNRALRELIETGKFTGDEKSVKAIKKLLDDTVKDAGTKKLNIIDDFSKNRNAEAINVIKNQLADGFLTKKQAKSKIDELLRQQSSLEIDDTSLVKYFSKDDDFVKAFNDLDLNRSWEYTEEELDRINKLKKNKPFMELVAQNEGAYKDLADKIKIATGLDYSDIVSNPAYARRARGTIDDIDAQITKLENSLNSGMLSNEEAESIQDAIDILERRKGKLESGKTEAFSSREYTQPTVVANRQFEEARKAKIDDIKNQIDNLQDQYADVRRANLEESLENISNTRLEKLKMKNEKIAKRIKDTDEAFVKNQGKIAEIVESMDDNFINKMVDTQDAAFSKSLNKSLDKANKLTKEMDNLTKQMESLSEVSDNVGYHYGDLGKGRDTNYFSMSNSKRSTGHFGRGTYFVGSADSNVGSMKGTRTMHKISFDDYNLFTPKNDKQATKVYDLLKDINNNELNAFDLEDVGKILNKPYEELFDAYKKVRKVADDYGKIDSLDLLEKDSLSTIFMKELGYEGVDVRHLKNFDNSSYGSVIYDLKPGKNADELAKLTDKYNKLGERYSKVTEDIRKRYDIIDGTIDKKIEKGLSKQAKALDSYEQKVLKQDAIKARKAELTAQKTAVKEKIKEVKISLDNKIKNIKFDLKTIKDADDAAIDLKIKSLSTAKSILESQAGQTLFDKNFYAGIDDFIKYTEYTNESAKVFKDALTINAFEDENMVKNVKNMTSAPKGWKKVSGKELADRLNGLQNIISDSDPQKIIGSGKNAKSVRDWIETLRGETFYMDERAANLFTNVASNSTPQEMRTILNLVDKANTLFKKFSVLSPGFQVRNYLGNTVNMYLSGMPASQILKYQSKATNLLNSAEDVLKKFAKEGIESLSKDEQFTFKMLQQFYEGGFNSAGTAVRDLDKVADSLKLGNKSNLLNKATDFNMKLNENADAMNRMALLMYANDNKKYLTKLGAKTPVEAVKYALMDPNGLSEVEQGIIKKLIPFYTFTKQNLMFQATNILKNTGRYSNLMKSINRMYEDTGENAYYDYQKNNMQIPLNLPIVGGKDSNGNQLFLKANLPLSDLGEWLSNPTQKLASSLTPVIKGPVEAVTGKSTFTGEDLQTNEINKLLQTMGINPPQGVQNINSATEHILNTLGLQNVSSNIVKKIRAILEGSTGEKDPQQVWAEIFRSVVQSTNEENVELNDMYNDLEVYQAYVKQLENQGIDVPSVRDITSSNNIKLNNIKRKRTRL